jgi:tetratricopeptide (TPR) repeat protein
MAPLSSSNIPHIANTDHRILRRTDATDTRRVPRLDAPSRQPLLLRFKGLPPDDPSRNRDLGIGLAMLAVEEQDREAARAALPLLQAALLDAPNDLPALQARGAALGVLRRIDEAAAVFDALLARAPAQEEYLLSAAELAEQGGQHDQAAGYFLRALAINPNRAASHLQLAEVYVHANAWRPAAEQLEAALQLNPFDPGAHRLLLVCYLRLRQRQRAQAEFECVLQFNPSDAPALRRWFERELGALPD